MPTYDAGSVQMRVVDMHGHELYRGTMAEIEYWVTRIKIVPLEEEQRLKARGRRNPPYSRPARRTRPRRSCPR